MPGDQTQLGGLVHLRRPVRIVPARVRGGLHGARQRVRVRDALLWRLRSAAAEQAARDAAAELEGRYAVERRRWADLEAELRRQLDVQLRQVAWHRQKMADAGLDLLTGLPKET